MDRVIFSNRRIPTRFLFNIEGKLILVDSNFTIMEQAVKIINISFEGIEITFTSNDFLYYYLGAVDKNDLTIKIEFSYNEEFFTFENKVLWINVEEKGERNYNVYSALSFIKENKTYIKDKHLDLLVSQSMENIYIP